MSSLQANVWSLSKLEVENFKAIDRLTQEIDSGFTVLTGPNGCGKSCILESIGFGLGASPAELRVNNLSELAGNSRTGQRIRVALNFKKGSRTIVVGSSFVEGARLYLVNNIKTTKKKFSETLTDTLGFSSDSISWNISQRAVDDIVSERPNQKRN